MLESVQDLARQSCLPNGDPTTDSTETSSTCCVASLEVEISLTHIRRPTTDTNKSKRAVVTCRHQTEPLWFKRRFMSIDHDH